MSSSPISKHQVPDPIFTPHGETIYEMIGRPQEHGEAKLHSLAHVTISPGKASLAHHHQVCEETYYVLKGAARMVLDGQEFSLSPGQACLILPGQTHQIFNPGSQELEFLAICAPAWYPEDSFYDA